MTIIQDALRELNKLNLNESGTSGDDNSAKIGQAVNNLRKKDKEILARSGWTVSKDVIPQPGHGSVDYFYQGEIDGHKCSFIRNYFRSTTSYLSLFKVDGVDVTDKLYDLNPSFAFHRSIKSDYFFTGYELLIKYLKGKDETD